ncbi:MAG: hypothetical protein OYH77_07810 [Pseudomonadota bacterium]|nr:hypothetical protein [Pseudomonadota bacterium]
MRSLHVWLLTGVLAAAACKPAVRDGSSLQQAQEDARDEKIHKILIGSGVGAVAILGAIGIKQKWWQKISFRGMLQSIKNAPGRVYGYLRGVTGDIGEFIGMSNKVSSGEFNKIYPRNDWEKNFGGLPYNPKARRALIDHLSIKKSEAVDAVKKGGKSVDEVLADDSLRYISRDDLKKELKEIYSGVKNEGANLDEVIDKMIKTVDESELQPKKVLKKLNKLTEGVKEVADETPVDAAS